MTVHSFITNFILYTIHLLEPQDAKINVQGLFHILQSIIYSQAPLNCSLFMIKVHTDMTH